MNLLVVLMQILLFREFWTVKGPGVYDQLREVVTLKDEKAAQEHMKAWFASSKAEYIYIIIMIMSPG